VLFPEIINIKVDQEELNKVYKQNESKLMDNDIEQEDENHTEGQQNDYNDM